MTILSLLADYSPIVLSGVGDELQVTLPEVTGDLNARVSTSNIAKMIRMVKLPCHRKSSG